MHILNANELLISSFIDEVHTAYQRMYSTLESEYGEIVAWCGRLALTTYSITPSRILRKAGSDTTLSSTRWQTIHFQT